MARKDWELELGERKVNPIDADELLKDKISERKRKLLDRQEEIDEAAHKAKLAELQKKVKTSEVAVDKAEKEQPSESPFKVTGEVKMGTIDFQKRQEEAEAELKRLKDKADEQTETLGQVNQQLRDQLHQKELDILSIGLQAQIQASNKRMEDLIERLGTKKNFLEEYTEAIATAKQLGIYNPQAGTDASVQIELKKMEFEHTMELRKMMREEKRADRQFQLELKKFDEEREYKKEELQQKKKRDEMFASTPEVLGRVIARGLLEGGEGSISEEAPSRGKRPGIVAGVGESGEAECPQCQQPIAIGPTARVAVCAGCGTKYPIKRTAKEEAEE